MLRIRWISSNSTPFSLATSVGWHKDRHSILTNEPTLIGYFQSFAPP